MRKQFNLKCCQLLSFYLCAKILLQTLLHLCLRKCLPILQNWNMCKSNEKHCTAQTLYCLSVTAKLIAQSRRCWMLLFHLFHNNTISILENFCQAERFSKSLSVMKLDATQTLNKINLKSLYFLSSHFLHCVFSQIFDCKRDYISTWRGVC